MTARFSDLTKKLLCWLLLLFFAGRIVALGQKNLSGDINQPFAHVTAFTLPDEFEVDDYSGFNINDTILIIQVQGVAIGVPDDSYGFNQDKLGSPGKYEFLIIESKVAPNKIVTTRNRINNYDVEGNVQIVRVPFYNSANVTGKLFCDPWDPASGKGGVLALIIGRTLKLNADIDVSGLGLRGGGNSTGDGVCYSAPNPTYPTDSSSFHISQTNAGFKGEGIAIHGWTLADGIFELFPYHVKGEGPNYTGGGGGNGRYSGGGGGSNHGNGGTGGFENCTGGHLGGEGGSQADVPAEFPTEIFMGGGGGASTSQSGNSVAGGNGGGIVIIVTDTIIGNGGRILANGNPGNNAVPNGGAGGGGAGGTIALSLMSYGPASHPLHLYASGGKGGDNSVFFGEGGGGGGGFIYLSKPVAANVVTHLNGGLPGNYPSNNGGTAGTNGGKKEDFKALLNGFLFNSIRSSVTGTLRDSICSDRNPPVITGTVPVGGTPPFTYKWERKTEDEALWTTLVVDNVSINYTPVAPEANPLTDTIYYVRTVEDSSIPTTIKDVSKVVKVVNQKFIKNNTIGADQTICQSKVPAGLVSMGVLADGNGFYEFSWLVSTDNSNFSPADGVNNTQNYNPPALNSPSWFKRTVTSGRCENTSGVVAITVLDSIKKNRILNLPADICNGTTFDDLLGSKTTTAPVTLSGGDNTTYRYEWESNINGSGWIVAPGTNNSADYNPGELPERVPMNEYYFRRKVFSGSDICSSVSNTVRLRDYPHITGNSISAPQTICSGDAPVSLSGTTPLRGDGTYTFTWQDSSKANSWSWTDIPGVIRSASVDYQPPALSDTIRYRRIVFSSACSDTSRSIRIDVHKPITKFSIATLSQGSDTTICSGQDAHRLRGELSQGGKSQPGSFSYQWYSSANNADFNPVSLSGSGPGYDPPPLTSTTYFKRETRSGACTVTSGTVKINVLPPITGNVVSSNQTICYNTIPLPLTGTALAGGTGSYSFLWEESPDGISWHPASGNSGDPSGIYAPSALTRPLKFRRIASSGVAGCCSDTSGVIDILIHPPLPSARIINEDTTIYSGTPVILKLNLTGTGPWKVTWSENTVEGLSESVSDNNAELTIEPRETGVNTFIYRIIKVEDANGCLATDITGELAAEIFPGFEIPEGFSPNGDGINDVFTIKGLDPCNPGNQVIDLRIVTTSGAEVFHTTNSEGGEWMDWDGTDSEGKELAEGTYYYLLKVRTVLNDNTYKLSGFIILKRY